MHSSWERKLEKLITEKIPACTSPRLVTTALRQCRAYRQQYAATSGLATTNVGLSTGLAYDRVMHTAPGHRTALASVHFITKSGAVSVPQKVQDVNDLRWHLFNCSVTERY